MKMKTKKKYIDMSRKELLENVYWKNKYIKEVRIARNNLRKQIYEFRSRIVLIVKRVRRIEDDLNYILKHPYSKLTTKSMNNPPIARLSRTYHSRRQEENKRLKNEMPPLQQGN